MKRLAIVIGLLVLGALAVIGVYLYSLSLKPMYEPGLLSQAKDLSSPLTPPQQPADPSFWTAETGIQLHYFSQGSGADVLVIAGGPGYPFTQPLPGLKPLTGQYTFYYYDQRGSGQSTRPVDKFTSTDYYQNSLAVNKVLGVGAQVADIERIRQILKQDRLVLIGHSFGGFLAAMYAVEFPEHVKALILVDPADILVLPQADGGIYEQVRALLPESQQQAYLAFMSTYLDFEGVFTKSEKDLVGLNNQFAAYYAQAAKVKGFTVPSAGDPSLTGGWMVQGMYLSMGTRHDYRDALKKVTAPTLVIHGGKDIQTQAGSQQYTDLIPRSTFSLIPNAGHFPFDDQPDQFAKIVGDFLNKIQ